MLSESLLLSFATALVVAQAPAPQFVTNPGDVVLRADFPSGGSQTVVGVVQFYSINGTTKVHVDITGLPKNSGMFSYHIHDKPVGIDGKCESTGGQYNPYDAPANCDDQPSDAYCRTGDLSGKHGLINTTCFETFYYDPYISLDHTSPQYIGGKSVNIHLVDKHDEILACGNIRPSRDPEDLLLLNAVTEAAEVQKYEELAGVRQADADFEVATVSASIIDGSEEQVAETEATVDEESSDLLDRRETNDNVEEEVIEEVVEVDEEVLEPDSAEENAGETNTTEEQDSIEKDIIEEEENENDLDELINEDIIEKRKNFSSVNSTNVTVPYNVTANITGSDSDDDEENSGKRLATGAVVGSIVAVLIAMLV